MNNSEIGVPDLAPQPKGKYDITAEQRRLIWQGFITQLTTLGHLLSARATADETAMAALTADINKAIETALHDLQDTAAHINSLAPLFAREMTSADDNPLIPQYLAIRDLVRCKATTNAASNFMHRAECIVADMRRRQLQFDIEAEINECRHSQFFAKYTKGITKYLGEKTEAFKEKLSLRGQWSGYVRLCTTAIEDDLLQEEASKILKEKGFQAFADMLTVTILLLRHAQRSSNRDFTDSQYQQAFTATLTELDSHDVAYLLGIWHTWKQMRQNSGRDANAFVKLLLNSDYAHQHKLKISADSQFRKRAKDKYLDNTPPEEWDFGKWEDRGHHGSTKTVHYLNKMTTAAILFQRHLDNIL